MSGHEPEKPRRPPERPVDPGEDPEASSDPDYSSDPDTTGYRDPTGDPNAPSQSPVASGDTHEEPGEDQPSRTPDDPFSADNQGSDPLPDVKTRSRGGPAIGRQPDGTVQTVTLPSAMDRTKIVDQSLKNSQPDEAPLRALLDTYQQSLTEKGSPDVRSVPDRYEVLSDYVARDFATREADAAQKSAQQQVFDTIQKFELNYRYYARDPQSTRRPAFTDTGATAIKAILAYVEAVAAGAERPFPNTLMRLLGVAERIGHTVIEAKGDPLSQSLLLCDFVASTGRTNAQSEVLNVSENELRAWDIPGKYGQLKAHVLGTAKTLDVEDEDYSLPARNFFDVKNANGRTLDDRVVAWSGVLKSNATMAISSETSYIVDQINSIAFNFEAQSTVGADSLDANIRLKRVALAAHVRTEIRYIAATMAYRLRNK